MLSLALQMIIQRSRKLLNGASAVALVGIMLGVACLFVAMAVISGYENTLKNSVADMSGHIQILGYNGEVQDWKKWTEKIKNVAPSVQQSTRFAIVEGILAHGGKLSGIILEGIDPSESLQVLNLKKRLVAGEYLSSTSSGPTVLIGQGIAKDFSLKVGDSIRVVIPIMDEMDPANFRRKVGAFKVGGILDLGKYEYDQRMMITDMRSVQEVSQIGERYSGLLLKISDMDKAREVGQQIGQFLGASYRVRDWKDVNENLFEAIRIERVAIFLIVFIILVAAAFNVSSSLYISVVQRYPDISIFKALGFSPQLLLKIFSLEGILIGVIGSLSGLVLGLLVLGTVFFLENHFHIVPGSIYKLNRIDIHIRWIDVLLILVSTLLITGLATFAPARKGARLSPVEGLRSG